MTGNAIRSARVCNVATTLVGLFAAVLVSPMTEAAMVNINVTADLSQAVISGGGTTLALSTPISQINGLGVGDVVNIHYSFLNGLRVSISDPGAPNLAEVIALDMCCSAGSINSLTSATLIGYGGDAVKVTQTNAGTAFGNSVLSAGGVTGNLTNSTMSFWEITTSATVTAIPAGRTFNSVRLFVSADTVSVAPVPLPAAIWLLASGLGGLGLMRRRTHQLA